MISRHLPITQYLLSLGAGVKEDIWIDAIDFIKPSYFTSCILIGVRINDRSVTRKDPIFSGAITNVKELREALIDNELSNIPHLYRAVVSKLAQYPKDEELKRAAGLLKNFSSLRYRCLFFVADNHLILKKAYTEMLPEELIEEVSRARSA